MSFEFLSEIGAFAFPVQQNKSPIPGYLWTADENNSNDPAQWGAWIAADYSLAINAGKSNIIIIDIDAKGDRNGAWSAWCNLCALWGIPVALPAWQTQSGGWHVLFRIPSSVDASTLRQPDAIKKRINVRAGNGYALCPPSPGYVLLSGAKLHDAPPALIEHCTRPKHPQLNAVAKAGTYDINDIAELLRWLASRDSFSSYEDWVAIGMACREHFGDDGLDLWRLTHDNTVTPDVEAIKWRSFSTEPKPGNVTFATWMKRAHALGWKGTVRNSAAAMFGGVAAPTQDSRVSLIGGPRPQIVAPEYSEIEVADRFANEYATQLRYVKARGEWLYWNGKRWTRDETDYVPDLARAHCRQESALCASTPGQTPGLARSLCSDRTMNAVLRLARVDQRIASRAGDWDQNPWLLGTPDGIVELKTGTLRAARPEDQVTKCTAVSPGTDCPLWLRFLDRATNRDVEKQQYLQRMAGYFLTGSIREQSLHFAYGPGRTGKGTFMHAIASILRDYHVTTAIETLTESKSDRHPAEIAALQGARLVTCSETERGRHWAESRIKQLTGGDEISARYMNQNFFTFTPTFKLLISGNYKPHLRPDSAMRRRFQLIPFDVTIPEEEQDPELGLKLEREWPGILGWMIAGAVAWQQEGLKPSKSVLSATQEYMDDEAEGVVEQWIADRCVTDSAAQTKHDDLYRSYRNFAEQSGEKAITSRQLGREFVRLGFGKARSHSDRLVVGIALAPIVLPPPPPPYNLPAERRP